MDIEALHSRREARRRASRRRRRTAGLIAAAVVAVAVAVPVVLATHSRGGSQAGGQQARSSHASAQAHAANGSRPQQGIGVTRAGGRPGTAPVPILMYHVIAAPPPGAPFPGLYVTPNEF